MTMIRPFAPADIEPVLDIWLRASTAAHDFVPASFWKSKLPEMRNVYIPASRTYVYEVTGVVLGFLSLHDTLIAAMFVSPEAQGRGIGRELIAKAQSLCPGLKLRVYQQNTRAIRFYERSGFVHVGEQIDEHTGHPELVMKYQRHACGPAT